MEKKLQTPIMSLFTDTQRYETFVSDQIADHM